MFVVNLASAGFVATGHIGHLEMADQIQMIGDPLGQIALAKLLVVHIKAELDVWAAHLAHDGEALIRGGEEGAGVIKLVQRFKHQTRIGVSSRLGGLVQQRD